MIIFKRIIIEVIPTNLGKYSIVSKQKISIQLVKTKKALKKKEQENIEKEKSLKKLEEDFAKEVEKQVKIQLQKIGNCRNDNEKSLLKQIEKLKKENENLKNEIIKKEQIYNNELNRKKEKIYKLERENSKLSEELRKINLKNEEKQNNLYSKDTGIVENKKQDTQFTVNEESALDKTICRDREKILYDKEAIDNFYIVPNDNLLFNENKLNNIDAFKKIKDLDGIINFLKASNNEDKNIYIKILNKFSEMINKFINDINFDNYDEDELSEELSEGFFKILKKHFIDKLMVGIYRGLKTKNDFYLEFLRRINSYLEGCNVYTRLLKVNTKKTKEDDNDIDILPKPTEDENKNNVIEEIEMLPYYLNYIDEYGEIEAMFIRGRAVVLSSKLN